MTEATKMTKGTKALARKLAASISETLGANGRAAANVAVDEFRESMRINRGKRVNVAIEEGVHRTFSKICSALGRNKQVVVTTLVDGWNKANAHLAQRRLAKDAESLKATGPNRPSCVVSTTPTHQDTSGKT